MKENETTENQLGFEMVCEGFEMVCAADLKCWQGGSGVIRETLLPVALLGKPWIWLSDTLSADVIHICPSRRNTTATSTKNPPEPNTNELLLPSTWTLDISQNSTQNEPLLPSTWTLNISQNSTQTSRSCLQPAC